MLFIFLNHKSATPTTNLVLQIIYLILIFMTSNGVISNAVKCWKWDISKLITKQLHRSAKYAVVVLNRPFVYSEEFITSLWNNALIRITVDGGTSRWDEFLQRLPDNTRNNMKIPDLITGDFDSIRDDILQKYKNKLCKVIHTPNQNDTDFTKALIELKKLCKLKNMEIDDVITVCQSSGRLDHILGNIQTLFLVKEKSLLGPNTRLYLMTDDAVSWLLFSGYHVINVPEQTLQCKRAWCSIVPIAETCSSITTTGLKWNLNNQPLKFGGLVSTSNTFDGSEVVTIKCSNTVLWSMKVPGLNDSSR